jgi:hypothetical protein
VTLFRAGLIKAVYLCTHVSYSLNQPTTALGTVDRYIPAAGSAELSDQSRQVSLGTANVQRVNHIREPYRLGKQLARIYSPLGSAGIPSILCPDTSLSLHVRPDQLSLRGPTKYLPLTTIGPVLMIIHRILATTRVETYGNTAYQATHRTTSDASPRPKTGKIYIAAAIIVNLGGLEVTAQKG